MVLKAMIRWTTNSDIDHAMAAAESRVRDRLDERPTLEMDTILADCGFLPELRLRGAKLLDELARVMQATAGKFRHDDLLAELVRVEAHELAPEAAEALARHGRGSVIELFWYDILERLKMIADWKIVGSQVQAYLGKPPRGDEGYIELMRTFRLARFLIMFAPAVRLYAGEMLAPLVPVADADPIPPALGAFGLSGAAASERISGAIRRLIEPATVKPTRTDDAVWGASYGVVAGIALAVFSVIVSQFVEPVEFGEYRLFATSTNIALVLGCALSGAIVGVMRRVAASGLGAALTGIVAGVPFALPIYLFTSQGHAARGLTENLLYALLFEATVGIAVGLMLRKALSR